jgi:hypothetical protein
VTLPLETEATARAPVPSPLNWLGPGNGNWVFSQEGSKYDYQADRWYFLVFQKQNTNFSLYIDGSVSHTNSLKSIFTVDVGFYVGACSCVSGGEPPGEFFNGEIDDVRIYNRSFAPKEIEDLYFYEYPSTPSVAIRIKTIQVTMRVRPGNTYQLEASTDLVTWNSVGSSVIPLVPEISQEFDIQETGGYFRIKTLS